MQNDEFDYLLKKQIEITHRMLEIKATEYAREDRLHNFKQAAHIQRCTQKEALGGMLVKHLVSLFDMIGDADNEWSIEAWDEKITDSINYLILLKAVVYENAMESDLDVQPELQIFNEENKPTNITIVNTFADKEPQDA